jgi:hypothetical protein
VRADLLEREVFGEESRLRGEVAEEVGVRAAAGEDADASGVALGIVTGGLERFPRRLENKPLLRLMPKKSASNRSTPSMMPRLRT